MTTKTNAMRILDMNKIKYTAREYSYDENDLSGVHAAEEMNIDPTFVFKTLVTKGEKTGYHVFCIPVSEELDLKKCALAANDKKIEMIHVKDLLGLTGYIRGGCSPIGMKKQFPTHIELSAEKLDIIYISAGMRGHQIGLSPTDLQSLIKANYVHVIKE